MSEASPAALIVEDDPQIRRFVRASLESDGWRVTEAVTLKQGLVEAGTRRPDLVVLDLGLPDGDGIDFVRDFRAWSAAPIIVLSARIDESGKVAALDAGADDYLTKPFGVAELLARARAHLRRQQRSLQGEEPVFVFGEVRVDLAARRVTRAGTEVHLTPIEYRLLTVLITNVGRVLTQRQLMRDVWGPAYGDRAHYLRVHMSHLRHKLEDDPAQPRHLLTETAVGYRLVT